MEKQYQPQAIEAKWYAYWVEKDLFTSQPDHRPAYAILMPPPNVTGILHMGHVLNNTLQDVIARYRRMQGYNVCWVPGTDHASIATEAKVVAYLRSQGIDKRQLSREDFLRYAWEWSEKYGGIILQQLRKLGASCDWKRTRFTMEPALYRAVIEVFIRLYQEGMIYRGERMIHWDPEAQTALSDEEVIYKPTEGALYYVRYYAEDGTYLTVATTRPETILADVAVAVHPQDDRFRSWIGRQVRVPLTNRWVPVIADQAVDPAYGTGCLKVTPAHDVLDFEIGQRHHLPRIEILTPAGYLNANAGKYEGWERFAARAQIAQDLQAQNLLEKIEPYTHAVGYSERTQAVVEPRLSLQWFLKMKSLAQLALQAVESGEIRFFPGHYAHTYRHWLENVRDWCISRQLWWGHRIPAYYAPDGKIFVAHSLEKAQAQAAAAGYDPHALEQDPDVLDTWFSSWLWPLSVWDYFEKSPNPDFEYYYPTRDLVTGPEIIFFWVARMVMAGYHFAGKKPFSVVYVTGTVRDKLRRKMSKSLGNSPDPLDLIAHYGADSLRLGVLMSAPAGTDILFDEALCQQGRNFCNKIWNSLRLIRSWQNVTSAENPSPAAYLATQWFEKRLAQAIYQLSDLVENYRFSEAMHELYGLIWEEFCSWYLEWLKPVPPQEIQVQAQDFLFTLMQLLHPFMPFITEEVGHLLQGKSVMGSSWPVASPPSDKDFMEDISHVKEVIRHLRRLRRETHGALHISVETPRPEWIERYIPLILQQVPSQWHIGKGDPHAQPFVVAKETYYVSVALSDARREEEKNRLQKELDHARTFLESLLANLRNENFLQRAPAAVVERERKKVQDTQTKIQLLEKQLEKLG
ncbi:MAG: valine--tRNA ligase [Bacteroidia bacterium]